MKCKTSKKWNAGFTLVEILAATAIVVILLAVGTVSVVRYAKLLQLTELDNAAREIYMAAEHQAALLAGSGRLEGQVVKANGMPLSLPAQAGVTPLAAGGTGESSSKTVYIKHSGSGSSTLDALVPEGTIDPALREGSFYVVYDVNEKSGAGSVTDVFYAEETDMLDGFDASYADWKTLSRQDRLSKKLMFGYYGGEAATSGGTETLERPELFIENGEELKVTLTYSAPVGETRTPKVILTYEGQGVELALADSENGNPPLTGGKKSYTWVLDTLKDGGHKFSHWVKDTGLGDNFTVTATIESNTAVSDPAMATGNSLFADNSDGGTAYIANLRHLQNLDRDHSGVAGKTAAVQTEDIDCGTSMFTDYKFKPIVNNKLKSYCGSYAANGADSVTHAIKGLKVTADSAKDKNGAGLFATAPETLSGLNLVDAVVAGNAGQAAGALAGTVASGAQVSDVHMINAVVKAEDAPAGALAGSATNASFDGCRVYWEMDIQSELRGQLTNEDGMPKYQITGSSAGGLAGELDGGSITNCLAATLVEGTEIAGGLVGQAKGKVTVKKSYADCYLTAPTAAGLIGIADGTEVGFENVYAAGFIDGAAKKAADGVEKGAAGLCNGTATANHAYSAMRYENTAENVSIVPLADGVTPGKDSCYYLGSGGASFETMTGEDFRKGMGSAFGAVGSGDSHPYNLRDRMALEDYPFPGLAGLPHYGDWDTEFTKASLVYFEQYAAGGYGFHSVGVVDYLQNGEGAIATLDGYAVAFKTSDESFKTLGDSFEITFYDRNQKALGSKTYQKNDPDAVVTVTQDGTQEDYYLAFLPDTLESLIDAGEPVEKFYQLLGFKLGEGEVSWFAFNPHFAKTARAVADVASFDKLAGDAVNASRHIYIRTPRHLRALSGSDFANSVKQTYWSHGDGDIYVQELDLDYETYTGYGWPKEDGQDTGKLTQDPIGRQGQSFRGTYDGQCHTIRGVQFRRPEGENYVGLFGVSSGRLLNIAYLLDGKDGKDGAATELLREGPGALYVGGLVGRNNNEVYNCAVAGLRLQTEVSNIVTIYAGGLVGENEGLIHNCSADVAGMDTAGYTNSTLSAGGLAGLNGSSGVIRLSYAVGRVASKADSTSTGRVCGFVGENWGAITDSYAAVRLEASGAGVETYGFCGQKRGTQANNYFVNRGNLTYRGELYNATYDIRPGETKAREITYGELTDSGKQPLKEMAACQLSVDGNPGVDGKPGGIFPMPTGVKKNGKPVHYGRWPEAPELGLMGVYYWERMELPVPGESGESKVHDTYNVSMLAVDPADQTVSKYSTLSETHSDGGVVVDYGYGYYYSEGTEVTATTSGIYYTADGKWGAELFKNGSLNGSAAELDDVNKELATLMSGYDFRSFRTFVPNPNPNVNGNFTGTQAGLYSVGTGSEKNKSPNGTVTLKQNWKGDAVEATFEVNPHFADALAIQKKPNDYKVDDASLEISPGTQGNTNDKKGNPYEVRAMGQLSAINWNSENLDTKTVLVGQNNVGYTNNCEKFPYLTNRSAKRDYCWEQTHDIDGQEQVCTPIAEAYIVDNSNLYGWFGGTYDGYSYAIENVNIQGQTSTVTGLFGVVYNGTLQNILLHSSDGSGRVSSGFDTTKMRSANYYIGTLAGLAASNGDSAVVNCSATGYTLYYKTYNVRDAGFSGVGGSGVGGLLGMSNMELKNCSAVNTIRIVNNPINKFGNDNLRAGGLVGIAKGAISNCYAGGEILVGGTLHPDGTFTEEGTVRVKARNGIFLGGIVSGTYFDGLNAGAAGNIAGGGANISLKDCYSYVTLPSQEHTIFESTQKEDDSNATEQTRLRSLYVLGGTGDGGNNVQISNCYYLESAVMKNNPNGFDTQTVYQGGSKASGNRTSFTLQTDIPYVGRTVTLSDGTVQTLTPDDVGSYFMVDCATYGGWYTRNITGKGNRILCRYFWQTDNQRALVRGEPIFMFVDSAGNRNDTGQNMRGVVRAEFLGWVERDSNPTIGVTDDPATLYSDPTPLTYRQLAGVDPIPAKANRKIYDLLPAFQPVTPVTANGSPTNEYSYGSAAHLNGLQYPFPTILTRTEEGRSVHVHYGDWPLNGVERVTGSAPIRMNLFSSYTATETLTASSDIPSGGAWTWAVTDGRDPDVASVKLAPASDGRTCVLTVTGNKVGDTSVTVTYTAGGVSYPVNIAVQVTARLRVKPQETPVYLFPGAVADIPLALCNEMGEEVTAERKEQMKLKLLLDESTCGLPVQLLKSAQLLYSEDEGYYYLHLEAVDEPELAEGQTALDGLLPVSAAYTYSGLPEGTYDTEVSALTIQLQALPEPEPKLDGEVTVLEIPEEITLGEGENAPKFKAVVLGAEVTEPADSAVVREGNTLRLAGYTPGTEVTLALELELTRQGVAGAPAQKLTCTQTVTVTIPEEETEKNPESPEGKTQAALPEDEIVAAAELPGNETEPAAEPPKDKTETAAELPEDETETAAERPKDETAAG